MESTEFFILLFFHLSFLILGFGSVLVTDLYGLLWMGGRVRFTQLVKVSGVTEKFIWAGYTGMVAAGIPLIFLKGEVDNLMILKFAAVAMIGINGYPLHLIQKKLQEYTDKEVVPGIFMFRMGLTLTISQIGWWSAVLIGFLHRHVRPIFEWPDQPWLFVALFFTGLLVVWGAGEWIFRRKSEETAVET